MSYWTDKLRELLARLDHPRSSWTPTVEPIPKGMAEMIEVYGDPDPKPDPKRRGKLIVSKQWEYANCKTVSASVIPGYHRRIYMHRLVAPHFIEAMRRAHEACPQYEFKSIGCFNPRHQRFDPTRPPSDHTWAIAFDINPEPNKWAPKGTKPFDPDWDLWSDLPRGVVEAFESVGFEWGGRWRGRKDSMHFSLRRV